MQHDPLKLTGQILRVLDGEEVCYHGFNQRLADLYLQERPGRRLEISGALQLTHAETIELTEVLAECRRFQDEEHLMSAMRFARPDNDQFDLAVAS